MGRKASLRSLRLTAALALPFLVVPLIAQYRLPLRFTRTSPTDLEIGGDLPGLASGHIRFVRYADLLRLPQRSFVASNDANFSRPVRLSGVPLELLSTFLGAASDAHMVTALCIDGYKTNYPAAYLLAHHPVLVLRVAGRPPARWASTPEGPVLGPYIISHATFQPSFRVLAHSDEPQIPWGVVRIDIRREADVYARLQPHGGHAADLPVQQGYTIARQNCFRCHNAGPEGGFKASRSWSVVARRSLADSQYFNTYVRNPTLLNPASRMAASPEYDGPTLDALRAYFSLFAYTPNDAD